MSPSRHLSGDDPDKVTLQSTVKGIPVVDLTADNDEGNMKRQKLKHSPMLHHRVGPKPELHHPVERQARASVPRQASLSRQKLAVAPQKSRGTIPNTSQVTEVGTSQSQGSYRAIQTQIIELSPPYSPVEAALVAEGINDVSDDFIPAPHTLDDPSWVVPESPVDETDERRPVPVAINALRTGVDIKYKTFSTVPQKAPPPMHRVPHPTSRSGGRAVDELAPLSGPTNAQSTLQGHQAIIRRLGDELRRERAKHEDTRKAHERTVREREAEIKSIRETIDKNRKISTRKIEVLEASNGRHLQTDGKKERDLIQRLKEALDEQGKFRLRVKNLMEELEQAKVDKTRAQAEIRATTSSIPPMPVNKSPVTAVRPRSIQTRVADEGGIERLTIENENLRTELAAAKLKVIRLQTERTETWRPMAKIGTIHDLFDGLASSTRSSNRLGSRSGPDGSRRNIPSNRLGKQNPHAEIDAQTEGPEELSSLGSDADSDDPVVASTKRGRIRRQVMEEGQDSGDTTATDSAEDDGDEDDENDEDDVDDETHRVITTGQRMVIDNRKAQARFESATRVARKTRPYTAKNDRSALAFRDAQPRGSSSGNQRPRRLLNMHEYKVGRNVGGRLR